MGRIYGYVRVSSIDQNEDRQIIALKEKGLQEQWIYMKEIAFVKQARDKVNYF